LRYRKVKPFCERPSALHHQQPEKDMQNVDVAPPPGKISGDTHAHPKSEQALSNSSFVFILATNTLVQEAG